MPAPAIKVTVDQRELQRAMNLYKRYKFKTDADVVNKAMKYWVPFAANKVKRVTPSKGSLRTRLLQKRKRVRPSVKKAGGGVSGAPVVPFSHALKDTFIAAIVAKRIVKKHGSIAASGLTSAEFYDKVQATLNNKITSVNYIRAGFIPIYKHLGIRRLVTGGHTHFSGHSRGRPARPSFTQTAFATAEVAREGAMVIAPSAFTDSIPEVTKQFASWIARDHALAAKKAGFAVKP